MSRLIELAKDILKHHTNVYEFKRALRSEAGKNIDNFFYRLIRLGIIRVEGSKIYKGENY